MLHGSCLCGAVAYESGDLTTPIGLCHCRTCQKAHASAYAPTARVKRLGFRWVIGGETVTYFESSPGKRRWFCPSCGTHLMAEWVGQEEIILRVGSLDDELGETPKVHIWMSHANAMLEAPDGIPELPEGRKA
jgi:hypothetical protein